MLPLQLLQQQLQDSITACTALTGGNVTADGGCSVTERGVCYSTSSNPTTSNSKIVAAGTTGSYSCSLTNLSAGTTYYVRSYAINSNGTSYGTQITFVTTTISASFTNAPFVFCENSTISNQTPTTSGNPNSFSISPSLPSGLSLNSITGVLTGTPTITSTTASYTLSISNSNGCSSSSAFNLSVNTKPTAVTAGSNSAICRGASTNLNGSATGAVVYNSGTLYSADFTGGSTDWQTNNVDRWFEYTLNNSAGGTAQN